MSNRFYPTPSDVRCYINGIEIDDMFRVDTKRQVNHQPIYGYNDQQFGFIAKGKELITGQLVLNFRYPGYLTAALEKAATTKILSDEVFKESFERSAIPVPKDILDFSAMDGMSTDQKLSHIAERFERDIGTNQYIVDRLKMQFDKAYNAEDDVDNTPAGMFDSPLDRGTHLYIFDMTVKYGNHEKEAGFRRIFRDCVLIGESSTYSAAAGAGNDMSSSSQPIFEIYPFFARTVDVVSNTARNTNSQVNETKKKLEA